MTSDRFQLQHQLVETRKVTRADGKEESITINWAESPLARLWHRRVIDAVQFDAGERLRRDFTLAGLTPRMGIDLTQPLIRNAGGQRA